MKQNHFKQKVQKVLIYILLLVVLLLLLLKLLRMSDVPMQPITTTISIDVSDIIDLRERDRHGFPIVKRHTELYPFFNGECYPSKQLANGDVILSDGSRLCLTECGKVFWEQDIFDIEARDKPIRRIERIFSLMIILVIFLPLVIGLISVDEHF